MISLILRKKIKRKTTINHKIINQRKMMILKRLKRKILKKMRRRMRIPTSQTRKKRVALMT